MYQCAPEEGNCKITFTYNNLQYNNQDQGLISQSVRDGFINECNTRGCGYSATIAWVQSYYNNGATPREINLCPIGFWITPDAQGPKGSTKASPVAQDRG